MRFRFCGGLDCPDWILAEIAVLSKLTSIKFRLLCNTICESIISGNLQGDKAGKILNDSGIGESEGKACLAALTLILKSSAKYECNSLSLNNELQQLGLPAELAQQLCKIYGDNQTKVKASLMEHSFRLPSITESSIDVSQTEDGVKYGRITLKYDDRGPKKVALALSKEKLQLLVNDLGEAVTTMQQLETSRE